MLEKANNMLLVLVWTLSSSSLLSSQQLAFAFTPPTAVCHTSPSNVKRIITTRRPLHLKLAARKNNDKNDDDDDSSSQKAGMNEAFRQLDALDSLGALEGKESTVQKLDDDAKAALSAEEAAPLEKEVELFTSMLEDSEQDESTLYSDVMKDMGGTPKLEQPSSSSSSASKGPQISIVEGSIPETEEGTEQFMNQAIQEALEEARAMSPSDAGGRKMSDSILDDEEIMKEIEEIFEKGNEKLLASLEEIREEQRALAKESAERRSKVAMDNAIDSDSGTKKRYAQAEASMEKQLSRVDKERAEVEAAVADLKKVQQDLEADPLMKMSSSALKPAALAGVLLFSARAALDAFAMTGGGIDAEAHMTAALLQGGIALVCAAYLIFF